MKILLADDIKLLCDCLKIAIERNSDFEVVSCVSNGIDAYEMAKKEKPDVVLMDIMMPKCDGIEATKKIKKELSEVKILILTTLGDEENVMKAMEAGADGYVLKDISGDELISAINSVKMGLNFIHKNAYSIGKTQQNKENNMEASESEKLLKNISLKITNREHQVIELIAEGLTNEEISNILGISVGRVRNIVTELIAKLMLKNRTQLAIYAVKNLIK